MIRTKYFDKRLQSTESQYGREKGREGRTNTVWTFKTDTAILSARVSHFHMQTEGNEVEKENERGRRKLLQIKLRSQVLILPLSSPITMGKKFGTSFDLPKEASIKHVLVLMGPKLDLSSEEFGKTQIRSKLYNTDGLWSTIKILS